MSARHADLLLAFAMAGAIACEKKGGGEIGRGGYGFDDATQISSTGGQSAQNPAFRDDGTLAYTRWWGGYNKGGADIRLLRLSPAADTAVTSDGEQEGVQNVSLPGSIFRADGNLVYSSDRDSGVDRIWITGGVLIGGEPVAGTADLAFEPTLSPDGASIAYERAVESDDAIHEIWRIAAAGTPGSATRLTGPATHDRQPNWSPVGDKILFQSLRDGDWEIYAMGTDGSGVLNVTASPETEDTDASWSPDGQWIVYSSDRRDAESRAGWANVWAIPAAGGTAVRVTLADAYDGAPSWSPDGTKIAFESNRRANERTSLFLITVPVGIP